MEGVYGLANGLGRLAIRILGVDIRWTGAEHIATRGPAILAATHVSYPDFVFIERAAITRGRYVRFMCRHDVWHGAILSRAMDQMRHIPVNRAVPAHAYLRARGLLEQGEMVGAFPEAGISHSFTVRSLMKGVASLARETGAPVVPTALWGGQRIYTVGPATPDLTRGRRVDLLFGEPMQVDVTDDLVEVTRELGSRLTAQLESLQQMPHHLPRPGERAAWFPAHLGGDALSRHQARDVDECPNAAVRPSWGPVSDARDP